MENEDQKPKEGQEIKSKKVIPTEVTFSNNTLDSLKDSLGGKTHDIKDGIVDTLTDSEAVGSLGGVYGSVAAETYGAITNNPIAEVLSTVFSKDEEPEKKLNKFNPIDNIRNTKNKPTEGLTGSVENNETNNKNIESKKKTININNEARASELSSAAKNNVLATPVADDGIPDGKRKVWAKREAVANTHIIETSDINDKTLKHLERVEALDVKRHKELVEAVEGSGNESTSVLGSVAGLLGNGLAALTGAKLLGLGDKSKESKDKTKGKTKSKSSSPLKGKAKIIASVAGALGVGKLLSTKNKKTSSEKELNTKNTKNTATKLSKEKTKSTESNSSKTVENKSPEVDTKSKTSKALSKTGAIFKKLPYIGAILTTLALFTEMDSQDEKVSNRDKAIKATGVIGGGVLGGAAGGAALGAGVGSIVPIVGTAIGGAIGLVVGGIVGSSVGGWVSDAVTVSLDKGVSGFSEKIKTDLGSLNTWVQELTGLNVKDSLQPALDSISGVYDDAVSAITGFKDSLSSWFTDNANDFNKWVEKKTGVDIAKKASETKDAIVDKGTAVVDYVDKTTAPAREKAGSMYSSAKSTVMRWFADDKEPVESQLRKVKTKPKSKSQKQNEIDLAMEFKGGRIAGLSDAESRAYAANTAMTESNGNKKAVNQYGYAGKYQFGAEAFEDTGLIKKGKSKRARKGMTSSQWYGKNLKKGAISPHEKFLKDPKNWTIKGGLNTYLEDESLQDKKFAKLTSRNIRAGKLDKNSSPEYIASYAKAAHLKGNGGANKLFKKGVSSSDANGMSTLKYAKQGGDSVKFLAPEIQRKMDLTASVGHPKSKLNDKHGSVSTFNASSIVNRPIQKTVIASSPVSNHKIAKLKEVRSTVEKNNIKNITERSSTAGASSTPLVSNRSESKRDALIIGKEVGKEVAKALAAKDKSSVGNRSSKSFPEHIPTTFSEADLAFASIGRT